MRLPAGTRDWLPAELRRKRAVENVLRGVFERWAYDEVQTPAFERIDVLEVGLGDVLAQQTFRFGDNDGVGLALRPEMTTPVARLVATRMREAPLPLRLSYVQPAFRYEEPQEGRMREFTQAGLELIGPGSIDADAESLFTAMEALDALGLSDARFDLNHAAIVDAILDGLELDLAEAAECKHLISHRNVVALRRTLEEHGCGDRALELGRLALARGGEEILDLAAPLCHTAEGREGIERLRRMLARGADLGYRERLAVDLSLLRDITYYTGFIFEGFVAEVGFALCGGGRYDTLLPQFGFEAGAVGWSMSVEQLLIALERRHSSQFGSAPAVDVLVSGSDVLAARERAAGRVVRMDFERRAEGELIDEARRNRIPRVVIAHNGDVREVDVGL